MATNSKTVKKNDSKTKTKAANDAAIARQQFRDAIVTLSAKDVQRIVGTIADECDKDRFRTLGDDYANEVESAVESVKTTLDAMVNALKIAGRRDRTIAIDGTPMQMNGRNFVERLLKVDTTRSELLAAVRAGAESGKLSVG